MLMTMIIKLQVITAENISLSGHPCSEKVSDGIFTEFDGGILLAAA